MIPLTISIAILDKHAWLTRLETDASLLAAIGTAVVDLVHPTGQCDPERGASSLAIPTTRFLNLWRDSTSSLHLLEPCLVVSTTNDGKI